jgi:glycosyltransferase EpsF
MDGLEATPVDHEIGILGGRVFKLPAYTDRMSKNLAAFRKILRENNYPIVHCHMNALSVFWLREAKRAQIPIRIVHNHSTAVRSEGMRSVMKYILRLFAKVYPTHYCCCSHYAGKWLFGTNFYSKGNVRLVRNAIDVERFTCNDDTRARLRSEMNLDRNFVVGHVGRFAYQKNHEFLLEIFAKIHALKPESVLVLVGDGPTRKNIEHRAAELGLSGSVRFLGQRLDVPELMQVMDVFVLPSRYEGLPVVAVEAQAAGLPCVLSTNITTEVMLTASCEMLNLSAGAEQWARTVIRAGEQSRIVSADALEAQGYNVATEARDLLDHYCRCLHLENLPGPLPSPAMQEI